MIGYSIANLVFDEERVQVDGSLGKWDLWRTEDDYGEKLCALERGMCANTYWLMNDEVQPECTDEQTNQAFREVVDMLLLLSFYTGRCVAVSGNHSMSDFVLISKGDAYIEPRSVLGIGSLNRKYSVHDLFDGGMKALSDRLIKSNLRVLLAHWISGVTFFCLEDLFLSSCVIMDIVKQTEMKISGRKLSYFKGMKAAASRLGIRELSPSYRDMRNDLVHEGTLSGTNHKNKDKAECSRVAADVLNWIDQYVGRELGLPGWPTDLGRWNKTDFIGTPSVSIGLS